MKMKLLIIGALFAVSSSAWARDQHVHGSWPNGKVPSVNLDKAETIRDALQSLAKQSGLSLVLLAHGTDQSPDVSFQNAPADEALEALCQEAGLHAEIKGSVLRVSDEDGDSDDEPGDADIHVNIGSHNNYHHDDRVVTGEDLLIDEDEEVNQAVATGGSLEVRGHVRGDAVAIGGKVTLRPSARVDGDAVSVGGQVNVEPGAKLHGDRISVGGGLGGVIRNVLQHAGTRGRSSGDEDKASDDDESSAWSWGFGILGKFVRTVIGFVLALLLIAFAPERVRQVAHYLEQHPLHAAGAGFLVTLCFIPMCAMLIITLIGIPLVPVLFVAMFVLMLFGYAALLFYVGDRLPLKGVQKNPLLSLAIGAGVVLVVDLIPYFGPLVVISAALVAGGAALLSRLGQTPKITA